MKRSGRRVVITGMGALAPTGDTANALFASQIAGRSGVGLVTRFEAGHFPTRIAAEVKGFEAERFIPGPERFRYCDRGTLFALAAGHQAVAQADLSAGNGDPTRRGVYLAVEGGGQDFHGLIAAVAQSAIGDGKLDDAVFCRAGLEQFHGGSELEQELHRAAAHIANEFECDGPNLTSLTACAAAAQAIGEATELIRAGDADVMIAGGAQSMIHPLGMTGFCRLTAMSTRNDEPERASRPFDRDRDGFVLGEGAGIVVLEEYEHARRRGVEILAELAGYGTTADAYRVTDPPPDGRGAATAMRIALRDAGLNPEEVGYLNAHGTSTPAGDAAETRAIRKAFGPAADRLAVSSSKSMIGHLVAAGGGVELVVCVMVLRHGVLPPTINYETPDPACDLDYVPNQAREAKVGHVMSNNFGFGGQNVSLVVSRI
jgi:3-oxoacyl-[acyl-carrier-protein] synthase II